jgi:hypothetical protein
MVVFWWARSSSAISALSVAENQLQLYPLLSFLHGNSPRPEEDRVARSNWRCGLELSTEFLVNRWGWSFDALVVV